MSKKAEKALPLVSPHWWLRAKAVAYSRAHAGEIADVALTALVNAGKLPVKLEWLDHQTNPPTQHRMVLSGKDYEFGLISSNSLVVQPRRPDVAAAPAPNTFALFCWGPTIEECWPAEEAEQETDAQHRRKPGTKAIGNWPDLLACEVVRVAVEEPKLIRNRSKLVTHLRRVLTAEIPGWNLTQDKAIHWELDHLFNRIASLHRNST